MKIEMPIELEATEFNGHVQTTPIEAKAVYSSGEKKWTLSWTPTRNKRDSIWVKVDSIESGKTDLRRAIVRRFDPLDEVASKNIAGSLSRSNLREHKILSEYVQKREKVIEAVLWLHVFN